MIRSQTFTEYPIPPIIMKNQSNLRHRLSFLLLTYPQPAGAAFATYVSKLRIDIFRLSFDNRTAESFLGHSLLEMR